MLSLAIRQFSTSRQTQLNLNQEKTYWRRKIEIYDKKKDNVLLHMFPEYDFHRLYPTEPGPPRWLGNMHRIAKETPNGINLIKNISPNQNAMLISDPVIKEIIKKSNELDGHTGGTMQWTLHNLSRMYNMGWISWVKKFLDEQKHRLTRK